MGLGVGSFVGRKLVFLVLGGGCFGLGWGFVGGFW